MPTEILEIHMLTLPRLFCDGENLYTRKSLWWKKANWQHLACNIYIIDQEKPWWFILSARICLCWVFAFI